MTAALHMPKFDCFIIRNQFLVFQKLPGILPGLECIFRIRSPLFLNSNCGFKTIEHFEFVDLLDSHAKKHEFLMEDSSFPSHGFKCTREAQVI